jgi:hypothetical protein
MEEGAHTTETEEIVGEVGVGVPSTEPPPQFAMTSNNKDPAGTHPSRLFIPLPSQAAWVVPPSRR